jgi:hypothetical protein
MSSQEKKVDFYYRVPSKLEPHLEPFANTGYSDDQPWFLECDPHGASALLAVGSGCLRRNAFPSSNMGNMSHLLTALVRIVIVLLAPICQHSSTLVVLHCFSALLKNISFQILAMAFTLYDATIVEAKLALATLDHILTEAEKHPNSASFPQARLYEDMNPLTFQVYAATRFSKKVLARLSGEGPIESDNDLVSFEDMHARIAEILELLGQADKDTVNRHGEEVATTELPSVGPMDITGKAFAMGAAIPNINFHVSMAYAILRKEGVPLGKRDYMMTYATEHIIKPHGMPPSMRDAAKQN